MKRVNLLHILFGVFLVFAFSSIFVYAKNNNGSNNKNLQELKTLFEQKQNRINNNNNTSSWNNGFHWNNPKRNNNKTGVIYNNGDVDLLLFSKWYIVRQIKTKVKEKNISVKKQINYKLNVLFDELEDVESVDDLNTFTSVQNTGIQENTINIIWFK